jgi:hypothetical protein
VSWSPLKIVFPFTRTGLVFFIAGLLFYCASSAPIIGSVSHPAGDWPSHLICKRGSRQCEVVFLRQSPADNSSWRLRVASLPSKCTRQTLSPGTLPIQWRGSIGRRSDGRLPVRERSHLSNWRAAHRRMSRCGFLDEFQVPLPVDHIVACCERVVPYAERERRMEAEIQIASLRVRCWGHQTDGDGCDCKI